MDCCKVRWRREPVPVPGPSSLRFFDEHRSELVLAKSVAEIRQARRDGRVSNVFGVQSAEALGSGFKSALGSAATPPRAFFEIGLRMVGIAYN